MDLATIVYEVGIGRCAGHVEDGGHDIRAASPAIMPERAATASIPAGQWTMSGVAMPPSCTQCLYRRKGALERLAQAVP